MNIDNITSDSMTLTYNGKAMLIKVYEQEIERLKEQLNDEIDDELKQSEIMVKQHNEIEKLHSIIKEVREFIEWHYEDNKKFYKNKGIGLNYPECDYILEILDKENSNE